MRQFESEGISLEEQSAKLVTWKSALHQASELANSMDDEQTITFEAVVICEYTRHWETHRINQEIGLLMDSALREIAEANRAIKYGDNKHLSSVFRFSHFIENSSPEWFLEILERQPKTSLPAFTRGFIAITSNVTAKGSQYQNILTNSDGSPVDKNQFSEEVLIGFYKDYAVSILSDHAFLFSLISNIAKPGSFQISDRYLIADKKLIRKQEGTMNSFENTFEVSQKFQWPPIESLNVFEVWDWAVKIPGFLDGYSECSLGRAIGASSYLLCPTYKDENELALVWALIGLESIYGTGNVGLKSQLLEKTEAFLGKRTVFKKEFGQVYDFRSRLIHGDKNFHFKGFERDIVDKFSETLRSSEDLAVATLVSTLQRMCVKKMYELNFKLLVN